MDRSTVALDIDGLVCVFRLVLVVAHHQVARQTVLLGKQVGLANSTARSIEIAVSGVENSTLALPTERVGKNAQDVASSWEKNLRPPSRES